MERWLVEAVKIVTYKRVGGMMKKYREILTYLLESASEANSSVQ